MGKRKRRAGKNKAPLPPDIIHAHEVDLQSKQALYMDAPDSSIKRSPGRDQNHCSSHRILLRHSRHPFGRHYSRRSSSNYSDASPSNWKGSPVYDKKLSSKPENRENFSYPYRGSTIFQPLKNLERIRSSFGDSIVSGDARKMECWICQKRIWRNPFIFEENIKDLSVVAVLVCGHVYHAACLEDETNHKNSQDPPCPLCVSQI